MAEEVTGCQEKSRVPCIWYMARAFTGFLHRGATDNSLNVIKPIEKIQMYGTSSVHSIRAMARSTYGAALKDNCGGPGHVRARQPHTRGALSCDHTGSRCQGGRHRWHPDIAARAFRHSHDSPRPLGHLARAGAHGRRRSGSSRQNHVLLSRANAVTASSGMLRAMWSVVLWSESGSVCSLSVYPCGSSSGSCRGWD